MYLCYNKKHFEKGGINMNLSYEEFIKLIPEDTKEYIEDVLRSITQFIILNKKIYNRVC